MVFASWRHACPESQVREAPASDPVPDAVYASWYQASLMQRHKASLCHPLTTKRDKSILYIFILVPMCTIIIGRLDALPLLHRMGWTSDVQPIWCYFCAWRAQQNGRQNHRPGRPECVYWTYWRPPAESTRVSSLVTILEEGALPTVRAQYYPRRSRAPGYIRTSTESFRRRTGRTTGS